MNTVIEREIDMAGRFRIRVERTLGSTLMLKFDHDPTDEEIDEAKKLALERDVPRRDAFHAVVARDNEAILITRDYHFQKLKDISIPRLPEDFI